MSGGYDKNLFAAFFKRVKFFNKAFVAFFFSVFAQVTGDYYNVGFFIFANFFVKPNKRLKSFLVLPMEDPIFLIDLLFNIR